MFLKVKDLSLAGQVLDGRLEHASECALLRHSSSSDVLWFLGASLPAPEMECGSEWVLLQLLQLG